MLGSPKAFRSHWQRSLLLILLVPFVAACSSRRHAQASVVAPSGTHLAADQGPVAPLPVPVEDPVLTLIAASDNHFKAGQKEVEQGHFEAAKQEFNRAVDVLLESEYGARTEPRIREHFDRLVDRISTYEVRALAAGDAFTEKNYEPASIDELLAASMTLGTPPATAELKDTVESDLRSANHDIPIP